MRYAIIILISSCLAARAFTPPAGIPDPGLNWGVLHPIDTAKPTRSSIAPGWFEATPRVNSIAAGDAHDCYYIDNSAANATDSSNTYGSPSTPRRTIPSIAFAAGSYVEIHGGGTNYTGTFSPRGLGTDASPIWIVGINGPVLSGKLDMGSVNTAESSYLLFDGLRWQFGGAIDIRPRFAGNSIHNVCIRNCALIGAAATSDLSGLMVGQSSPNDATVATYEIVVWNCEIASYGSKDAPGEECGVYPSAYTTNLFVLDCDVHDMAEDGFGGSHSGQRTSTGYYIGRCRVHDNVTNGVDAKQMRKVVISECEFYNFWNSTPHSTGSGAIVLHYSGDSTPGTTDNTWKDWPEDASVLFCTIHDTDVGVACSTIDRFRAIGNVFYNIKHSTIPWDPTSVYALGAAIHIRGVRMDSYIVNNTIYSSDIGIQLADTFNAYNPATTYWRGSLVTSGGKIYVCIRDDYPTGATGVSVTDTSYWQQTKHQVWGNLISTRSEPTGRDFYFSGAWTTDMLDFDRNLTYSPLGECISYGSAASNTLAWLQANSSHQANGLNVDPLLVNPAGTNFALSASSPAIGASTEGNGTTAYADFTARVGGDIKVDRIGVARPKNSTWDIGAYEYAPPIGTEYFISATGSDSNPGTRAEPFRTLAKAETMGNSNTVTVLSGLWATNFHLTSHGTYLRSDVQYGAVVSNLTSHGIWTEDGVSNCTIEGFFVRASGIDGIKANGIGHTIQSNRVWYAGQGTGGAPNSEGTNGTGQAIASHNAINLLVQYNEIGRNGLWTNHDHTIYVSGIGIRIFTNICAYATNGWGIQVYPASTNVQITGNLIYGNKRSIVVYGTGFATNYVKWNTIINTNTTEVEAACVNPRGGIIEVEGNICMSASPYVIRGDGAEGGTTTIRAKNNLVSTATVGGTAEVVTNWAGFADTNQGYFTLRTNSPARGIGTGGTDVGAFQYVDYFASPSGSTANSGTSALSPWPLSYAISNAQAGASITLASGNYSGGPFDLRTPVTTIRSASKWGAKFLDLASDGNGGIFRVPLGSYANEITIDGLAFSNCQYSAVLLRQPGLSNCVIRNLLVQQTGQTWTPSQSASGISIYPGFGLLVEDCTLTDNGTNNPGFNHGIYTGGTNGVYRRNICLRNGGMGIIQNGHSNVDKNNKYYGNLLVGNMGMSDGFPHRYQLALYSDQSCDWTNYAWNNTIISDGSAIAVQNQHAVITNCIISATNNGMTLYGTGGVEADYNLAQQTLTFPGTHDVITNYFGFTSLASGDYSLKSDSPARGAGLGGVDIGAYQFESPIVDPPTLPPGTIGLLMEGNGGVEVRGNGRGQIN